MTELARQMRNEYYRNYYHKNKERIKKRSEERWERKAAEKLKESETKIEAVEEVKVLPDQEELNRRIVKEIWSIASAFYRCFGDNAYKHQGDYDKCVDARLKEIASEYGVKRSELFGDQTILDRERLWL